MAWVNSCDEKWAHKVVQLKPDLCIVDYYGEEIRGKEYLCSTNRSQGQSLLLDNSMATAASVKNEGCSKMLARENHLKACLPVASITTPTTMIIARMTFEAAGHEYTSTSSLSISTFLHFLFFSPQKMIVHILFVVVC